MNAFYFPVTQKYDAKMDWENESEDREVGIVRDESSWSSASVYDARLPILLRTLNPLRPPRELAASHCTACMVQQQSLLP